MKRSLVFSILISGAILTAPGALSGQGGNAINLQNSSFDSHGDFVDCGSPNFGFTNQLTVAAWIKWTTNPGTFARTKDGHTDRENEGEYSTYIAYATHNTLNYLTEHGQFWLRNMKTGNHFQFVVENASGSKASINSTTSPGSGTWYFLAGTYDGTTIKLYVNGTLENSAGLSGNIRSDSGCRLNMGRLPWGYGVFAGCLDEARVWNVALTQSEIQNQKNSKSSIKDENCRSYWNFDAGSGTAVSDSKGLASGTFYTALIDIHGTSVDFPNKIIEDEDRSFGTGAWNGKSVTTVAGAGAGETNAIVSNTVNVFTLTYGYAGTAPDNLTTPVLDGTVNMTWLGVVNGSETSQWVSSSDLSLPVTLSRFSAEAVSGGIRLYWSTESEIRNLGFILERSEDSESWTTISSYLTQDALRGQDNTSNQMEYTCTDHTAEPGKEYIYRLSEVSATGEITTHAPLSVKTDPLPETTIMETAYPNPFNPETVIAYHLDKSTNVDIRVFDLLGRKVRSLYSGHRPAGSYTVYWDGTDDTGIRLASGCYFILMDTENTRQIQKVLMVK